MQVYSREPDQWLQSGSTRIAVFNDKGITNIDPETVHSFGEEWSRFSKFNESDIRRCGDEYFDIVDEQMVNSDTVALDVGCGTGRWSKYLAPRVKFIEAIDPSDSVLAAAAFLHDNENIRVTKASVDGIPFADQTFDFVFSLGVLHHIPDTARAIGSIAKKMKSKGTLLLYLYYKFDNRNLTFRMLFYASHLLRLVISKLPAALKQILCECIALVVYLPLAGLSRLVKALGAERLAARMPLSYYADKSYFIMRNDALDRFGTPLEHRFTREEITEMLVNAGFNEIHFSPNQPFWHVVAKKI
jgi:SAM-dependent methyltransferase